MSTITLAGSKMQVSFHPAPVNYENKRIYGRGFQVMDWPDLLPELICSQVWSGIVWRDGKRDQEHFVSADWAVFDFDDPDNNLDDIRRRYCDMRHIIGTTKSHQKEKKGVICDRFRLAVPFVKRIVSLEHYRQNMQKNIARLGCDAKCADGARFFFPCREIVSIQLDPDLYGLDVEPYVEPPPVVHRIPHYVRYRCILPKFRLIMERGVAEGSRNEDGRDCYKHLRKIGYSEEDARRMAYAKINLPKDELDDMSKSAEKYLSPILTKK